MSAVEIAITGLLGLTGVGLGAYGYHGPFDENVRPGFLIATNYQMIHAAAQVGILALLRAAAAGGRGARGKSAQQAGGQRGGDEGNNNNNDNNDNSKEKAAAALLRGGYWAMVVGTVGFCGTIYYKAFGGTRSMGRAAPAGGCLLMLGWLGLTAAAVVEALP